jgi:hypothetical protein
VDEDPGAAAHDAEDLEWVPRESTPDNLLSSLWIVPALLAGAAAAVGVVTVLRLSAREGTAVVGVAMFLSLLIVGWWRSRPAVRSAHWPRVRADNRGLTIIHGTDRFIPWDDVASVRNTRFWLATEVRDSHGERLATFPLALGDVLIRTDLRAATLADLIVEAAGGRLVADIRLGQASIRTRRPGEPRTAIRAQQDAAERVMQIFVTALIAVAVVGGIAAFLLR